MEFYRGPKKYKEIANDTKTWTQKKSKTMSYPQPTAFAQEPFHWHQCKNTKTVYGCICMSMYRWQPRFLMQTETHQPPAQRHTNSLHGCTHHSKTWMPLTTHAQPKTFYKYPSTPPLSLTIIPMARIAIIGALLMFLLALTEASIYRTAITTEVNDQSEMCQRQLSQVSMNSCIRYLQQPYMLLSRADVSQVKRQCCQELGQINRECRCEAVRQIVQAITGSQGQQKQQQQMVEVMRIAQQLPNRCGMEPQYCDVQQEEIREPFQSERCQRQLSQTSLDSCKRYLQPYQAVFVPRIVQQQLCCVELGQVSRNCRCEALRETVQTITRSQSRQQQGQKMEEVLRSAQQLPNTCGMEPQYCKIQQEMY